MRKLLAILILAVAAYFAWQYFNKPPDPVQQRARAQQTAQQTTRYWLEAAKEQRMDDLMAICDESAKQQAKITLEAIRQKENQVGDRFSTYDYYSMGAPGAFKAVLGGRKGLLLHLTIRAEEKSGKYLVVQVTPD